jgi:hypothetical protein
MLQRMEAEILFLDPKDVAEGSAVLIEHGFDVEVLEDRIDDYGPAVFLRVQITTELDELSFFQWVYGLVEDLKLSGDLVEAGLADQPHQYLEARFGPRIN